MAVGVTSVLGRLRLARFFATQLRDVLVVAAVCVVVVAVTRGRFLSGWVDPVQGTYVLILVAAALGAGAALCALVTHRVSSDPRPAWMAAALVLYGVVVLPLSSTTMGADPRMAGGRLASLTMFVIALLIMFSSLRPPARMGSWGGWAIAVAGGAAGAAIVASPITPLTVVLAQGRAVPLVALVGWTVVSVAFLIDGYRNTNPRRARLGLGLIVVAISQLYREVLAASLPTDVVTPALRMVGMAVVLLALLQVVQRSVTSLQSDYDQVQAQLTRAAHLLESATDSIAERDHEVRNGLVAVAGVVHVLSISGGDQRDERTRELLLHELSRVRTLLDTPVADPDPDAPPDPFGPLDPFGDPGGGPGGTGGPEWHLVRPVLETVVGLRPDQEIDLRVEGDPCAATEAAVTEQVVTNLLQNCARHAPGPVAVRGRAGEPGTVVVEVRDHGPGLPAGGEDSVFERGVRDESAGGSGLGLHISRKLAEENGGSLRLRTVHDPQGCLAVLTLPSV